MINLPQTLNEALDQAKEATQQAIRAGKTRLLVELVIPELKVQPIAWDFLPALTSIYGSGLKVFFPDAGAAALARRDWGAVEFQIQDIGNGRTPIDSKVEPTDEAFLLVEPSPVEVLLVEKLCQIAGDRPCIMLNPKLEDVSIVGIGYAARQLRDRFLSTLESSYYFRPIDDCTVLRAYPGQWLVWRADQIIDELPEKPTGETLEKILRGGGATDPPPSLRPPGVIASLQRFFRALSS